MPDYTPGPWGFDKTEVYQHGSGGDDGVVVADVLSDDYEADARLIAAAPTLLGCCEALWKIAAQLSERQTSDWAEYQTRTVNLISIRRCIEAAGGSVEEVKRDCA